MITRAQIDTFFSGDTIAMVGVSRDPKKFGHAAFKAVSDKKRFTVLPVNPSTDEINGQRCYRNIASLPDGVHGIVLMTKKDQTEEMLKQAMGKGIKNIWIQQSTDSPAALQFAAGTDANIIHGKCIIMFTEPTEGIHKFHRNILKLFGRLPR